MSPQVKRTAIDYFESIGGIESVDPEYRYALKRAVIRLLIDIDNNMSWDKFKIVYPMIGVTKPIKL